MLNMNIYHKVLFLITTFNIVHGSVPYNFSTFQEVLVDQPTPVIQLQFPYTINTDYVTTSISGLATSGGFVTQSLGTAILATNGVASGTAVLASKARCNYQAGQGVEVVFSAIFDNPVANNVQYIGIGNVNYGFFFGYNGTQFGILYRNGTDSWITQTGTPVGAGTTGAWNQDQLQGAGQSSITLNQQYGNTYKIQYNWLGFGIVNFYVQNPADGTWILVHTMSSVNGLVSNSSILNPSMQLLAITQNIGMGVGNVILRTGGMSAAIQGYVVGPTSYSRFSSSNSNVIGTTEQTFLSIQNNATYQSRDNQSTVIVDQLSLGLGAVGGAFVATLVLNPLVTGASYTNVAPNSVVSYDTGLRAVSYTGVTGARALMVIYLSNNDGTKKGLENINLSSQKISLAPSEVLVVTLQSLAGGTLSPVSVGLSWYEKQ